MTGSMNVMAVKEDARYRRLPDLELQGSKSALQMDALHA
jgi:hypothetical protein